MEFKKIRINGKDYDLFKEGRSAYQVAVDNGFKGTEAEWVASLKTYPFRVRTTGPDQPLWANAHYYLRDPRTAIALNFPTTGTELPGDQIFVQFVSGASVSVTLTNAAIDDFNFLPHSVIEIHAVYGVISPGAFGWSAVAYQRKVG